MIFVKFFQLDFLEECINVFLRAYCISEIINNFIECFKDGRNRQKCRKFVHFDRPFKATESILQYLFHVKFHGTKLARLLTTG